MKLLLILISANGTPVILQRYFKDRYAWPIDSGFTLSDGGRLFGETKTWRGMLGGIMIAALVAWLIGFTFLFGLLFGLLSLVGDLASSLVKRRMKLPSSSRAFGVDQIPEALLPLTVFACYMGYGATTTLLVTLTFFLLNVLGSPVLYRLGIRKNPH
ncbi:CDP-archaeol synthase [Alkalimarinus sediminis]|uniref:CDP-archaeol synthase n=1 Tax=Alkalimarinus sediminis TaxID=1632866 RepID=A0A9E8HK86_9ALTE|nr:CDP-archaeol synthase [Alkalimarinus sediminis]UZW74311.1 CDP-archaeol synthase [Alkalimarinus sediminis]